MDNYKFSRTFEQLAIKIVEEHFGFSLDLKKSHITSATRDYGIDSVIFFSDCIISSATIEAKLRGNDYTLGLKDIASSILFFLVRKGDEHYIVSNVYITEGTIETLELFNVQSPSKIYCIDGEKTKDALENLINKLTDPKEIELAETLINNFGNLKQPIRTKDISHSHPTLYHPPEFQTLYLRERILRKLSEAIKANKKLIVFRGKIGTGKNAILDQLDVSLKRSAYKIITVDGYVNNTIDIFCYEVTQKVIGLDLKDILCMLTEQEIDEIKQNLNEVETEDLDNIFQIFQNKKLSNQVATYLAKVYLKNLFRKFNQLKYIIEIRNYSYTSQEVFDFVKDFVVEAPENVSVIVVFSDDIAAKYTDFSHRYKQLYNNMLREVPCDSLSFDETKLYLKDIIPQLDDCSMDTIYNFTEGLPFLLEMIASKIKKLVLVNSITISESLSSLNIYLNRDYLDIIEKNAYALKFIFVLHLFSFSMKKSIWECIEKNDTSLLETQRQSFENIFFDNYQFIEDSIDIYNLKSIYIHNHINDYYIKNATCYHEYANRIKDIILSSDPPALTRIKLLFYCDDAEIVSEYNNNKHLWMFKTNISWKTDSLKYVCKYFLRHETEQIEYVLQAIQYYLEYLEIKAYHGDFERNILQRVKYFVTILENSFSRISKEYLAKVAELLAKFYRYQYSHYRKQSKFEDALVVLEKIVYKDWYSHLDNTAKIELEKSIALLYKSQGNRSEFWTRLDDILSRYQSNPYAKVIFWANMAARFYTTDAVKALECLEKCELDTFKHLYSNESKLYQWVLMDKGIISFYNRDIISAKSISYQVLNTSEKINYSENVARAYNLLGAIYLESGMLNEAQQHFYYALTRCVDEQSESFFHFTVNYLVTINKLEIKIADVIMNYIKTQQKRLISIFNTEKLETCRWFVTVYAFNQYLNSVAPPLQKELELIYGAVLKPGSSSIIDRYKIQNLPIVLF